MRGAVRRLLKGLPKEPVDRIAARFGASCIPWDFVDLIDRDPARRVRLRVEQDRLSKMHPRICEVCAQACDACATSCEAFPDDEAMRSCAIECRRCAASCRLMVRMAAKASR